MNEKIWRPKGQNHATENRFTRTLPNSSPSYKSNISAATGSSSKNVKAALDLLQFDMSHSS